MEKGNRTVNRLPAKTWYWLGVNEASIQWEDEATYEMEETSICVDQTEDVTEWIEINPDNEKEEISTKPENGIKPAYARKKIQIHIDEGCQKNVIMNFSADRHLFVETVLDVERDAKIRLVQIQSMGEKSLLYNVVTGKCAEKGNIELIQAYAGQGDVYSDTRIELEGDQGFFKEDMGYLAKGDQKLDFNVAVNHFGRDTESRITANGALKDDAKKVFRGTIDFKKGASNSVGNEAETVLMLGENVENKTVPLILCAEENVVGNHGATIGELDEETLFYFASRGIDREMAENILARASIERLEPLIGDGKAVEMLTKDLEKVLSQDS